MAVKQIVTGLNKRSDNCVVFCDLKHIVLKLYSKCWNFNSDKTEFRSKDYIEMSALTHWIRWYNNHVMHTLLAVAGDCNNWCFCLVKFIVCKWFQEKKKDNSFRLKISTLDEFKFECENAVLWITKMLCIIKYPKEP